MHRIDTEGHLSNMFDHGPPATIVDKHWLNAVQEELMGLLSAAGITAVKGTNTQVLSAIRTLSSRMWTMANTARLAHVADLSTTADARCIAIYGQYGVIGARLGTDGIWRSSNYGRSWTKDTTLDAILSNVNGLAFNSDGSVLVAVGSAVGTSEIAYSSDHGDTWTGVATPTGTQNNVCWSSSLGLFVSVGNSGTIYTSPTGATWTARTAAGTPANITFGGVCWSSALSLLVAVGTDTTTSNHIEIQTSADGITWTARSAAATSEIELNEVAEINFGGSTIYLVAGGKNGEVQYSANGTTWTQHPQAGLTSSDIVCVKQVPGAAIIAYGNTRFGLMNGITQISSARPPEDDIAPPFTTSYLIAGYSPEFGIVMAGPNGNIWQSFPSTGMLS